MSASSPATRILWSSVVVLGLLAIPFLCTSRGTLNRAYRKRAKTEIPVLVNALDYFAAAHGNRYPADLLELIAKDPLENPYLVPFHMRMPLDGWGHPYAYEPPTEAHPRPRVLCYGADGARGGTDDDADIDSDSLR